jgi:hypothetical protein|tara:strand:+ start:335 stop:616 length:282 start_codon:yes stop_codon:yes gene_type:complete
MIKIIQLATGEQLITGYDEITGELDNPLFINIQQMEKGPNIQLFPYDLIADGNITVNLDQIIWTADPDQKLLNQYQELFSKIITPPQNVTPIK